MPAFLHAFSSILLLLLLFASSALSSPLVMFDEAHAQQFLIGSKRPLDLSKLAETFHESGFDVVRNTEKLTSENLAEVDVLIVSGAFIPLHNEERQAVVDFVRNGGGLAVMIHIAPPLRDLLHSLDVDFSNGTLRESSGVIADNPLDFTVSYFRNHAVTSGLTHFSVYGAWALRSTAAHVEIIAATTGKSWVDLDHDNQLSTKDVVQKFGVMVAGELGQGRYLVVGDDALFQNRFFDQHNRGLALRIVKWLSYR